MPTVIWNKMRGNLDGSVKAAVLTFLEKLGDDDTTPGLHIEPMNKPVDPRVRTGRVNRDYRAVLFRLDGGGECHYLFYGVWMHDEAIRIARSTRLVVNPINGLPHIESAASVDQPAASTPTIYDATARSESIPYLTSIGYRLADLTDELGLPQLVAERAMACVDADALLEVAVREPGWIEDSLLQLLDGRAIGDIADSLGLTDAGTPAQTDADDDTSTIEALKRPAASTQYAFIADQDELRRVIDGGDLAAWRTFLHPEQRRLVEADYAGPARISGGAGTGKTVVLVHRARHLARSNPDARIVLTTYTTNLAASLGELVRQLDPALPVAADPGDPGIRVSSVDSLVAAVIRRVGTEISTAAQAVLGDPRTALVARTPGTTWREVLATTANDLDDTIANEVFLKAEYDLVIVPKKITTKDAYLRARRAGRGIALDRRKRTAVWALIESYRAQGRVAGSVDFTEAAAIAAEHLRLHPAEMLADHVLVDEAQDLTPAQLQFLRAVTAPGRNDLMLAEDSHQRIYGPKVVLGHYDIAIVGRSRRLTLNYRTTAQNLSYAMSVLEGADYTDLEGESESAGYRSARFGPDPEIITAADLSAELDVTADRIRTWLDEECPPGTLAVLVADRHHRDRVAQRLLEADIPAAAVDRGAVDASRVSVMTMHRAKGMEFARVVLIAAAAPTGARAAAIERLDPAERSDTELRARSLHYVAATRARDRLVVVSRQ